MRVLYSSFSYSQQWKIAKVLQEKHQWEPIYWMGDRLVEDEVTQAFPDIFFQDYIKARRAIHSNSLSKVPKAIIDKVLIEALAKHQITAMKIAYRCDTTGSAFTFNDLIEHYYEQLAFWLTVIHELKIQLFVCWCSPHSSEYVLYLLCKHLGIPVLYIDSAYCITKDTHLIASSIEDKAELLRVKYNQNLEYKPKEQTRTRLQQIQGDYSLAKPDFMSNPVIFGEKGKLLSKSLNLVKELLSIIRKGPFEKTGIHFKFSKGPYKSEDTSGNRIQLFLYYKRISRLGKQYKKIYSKYVSEINFNTPYIYYAAPYQPEATTLPDAGVYDRILLSLDMISAATPKDWTICFKEHPATFDAILGGNLYRSEEFYEKLSKIPKVKMIAYNTDTFKLIDSSVAVACATGTVGWEAIVRGKPSLLFGQAWYLPCDGAFLIDSVNDLSQAIGKIKNGYKPDFEKVLKFAGVVDQFCVSDLKFIGFKSRFYQSETLDKDFERFADVFFKAYNQYQELHNEKHL